MKKLILLLSSLALTLFTSTPFAQASFDKSFTGIQTEQYADGKPKYQVNIVKGQKQGLETFWYASY